MILPPRKGHAPRDGEPLARFTMNIGAPLLQSLQKHAMNRGVTQRAALEEALRAYLDPGSVETREAALEKHLKRVETAVLNIQQSLEVLSEWQVVETANRIGYLPDLGSPEAIAQWEAKTKARMDKLTRRVQDNLTGGRSLRRRIAEVPRG